MNRRIWVQRDGSRIDVEDMSDLHITNTLKMIQRNIASMGEDVGMIGQIHEHLTLEDLSTKRELQEWEEVFMEELNKRHATI